MSCKSIFYFLLFFFTGAFFYNASAQKIETRSATFPIDAFKAQQIETVALFDEKKANDFFYSFLKHKDADISFKLLSTTESKTAKHYLYQLLYKDIEVFNAQIKLSILQNGKVNSFFINEFPIPSSAFFLDSNTIKKHSPTLSQLQKYTITPVYFFDGEKTTAANRINYLHNNWDNIEIIVDANNEIIYQNNLNSFLTTPTDSLVKANVFMPDPLTSAQQNYASPYNDQSDADVVELNDQRNFVDMRVTFDNDTFWLYNDFVKITRFSAPDIDPVAVTTLSTFNYTRNQSQFEDVNVYYHLNQYNKYLKSLGFTNLVNYQIWVDTHALNGQDNSMFSSATTPARLFFGEGGVDDGEDVDVILHEYGHAISHSAAPNTNNGTERKTLDEANGDYFAASFSKTISNFKWDQVYTWDGHNEFWNGRMASTTKLYSQLSFPSIYTNTDIWSGTLMEIESVIGRNVMHEIVLESMHSYASNMTMAQAAWLLVKADSALNNGANYAVICPKIKAREFTSTCPVIDGMNENIKNNTTVRILNSEGFSNGECLQINSNSSDNKISLFSFDGTEVYTTNYTENEYKLCASNYSKGIYFLKITSNNITHTYKLIKF